MHSFASTLALIITVLLRLSSADTDDNPVVDGFYPFILVYKNGTVQRNSNITLVPPSPEDPATGVSSKDINVSSELPARIYLPKLGTADQKLPIFIWFHGGGFFMGSAFADTQHEFLNIMASRAGAIAISIDYRLVPEQHLPAAYDDAWTALQWVTAHKNRNFCGEPWLLRYADFDRIFIGGDSAGANIVHNTLMRAGFERCSIKILGGIQTHPYFWGSNETSSIEWFQRFANFIWRFAFPTAPGGIDNPMVNPFTENAPSLTLLGSSKLFVSVAEEDFLRDIGVRYVNAVKRSGWKGEVKLIEIEGVNHSFYFDDLHSEKAQQLITAMVSFLRQKEKEES